jgi:hypothetical protein
MEAADMRWMVQFAAMGVFVGIVVFWNLAVAAALRFFRISLPLSSSFHLFGRRRPEILEALEGRSINVYVLISGLLLFTCPLFAGLTSYDYVVDRFIYHTVFGLNYFLPSILSLVMLGICGVLISISHWRRSAESGIGLPMLVIIALKFSIDTMGMLLTVALLIPVVIFCLFVFFGFRSIGRSISGRQHSSCHGYIEPESNFIAEQFAPSERYKSQQLAMAQMLSTAGLNPEQEENTLLVPLDQTSAAHPEHPKEFAREE